MINEPRWHPDLLRRFVPTPYVFIKDEGPNRIYIESNDLEIALTVRGSLITRSGANRTGGFHCRLIRDTHGPVGGSQVSILTDGAVRTLYLGQGTILIHDIERAELLGFVSPSVDAHTLVSSLISPLVKLPLDRTS